jgi:hypothetical protein
LETNSLRTRTGNSFGGTGNSRSRTGNRASLLLWPHECGQRRHGRLSSWPLACGRSDGADQLLLDAAQRTSTTVRTPSYPVPPSVAA